MKEFILYEAVMGEIDIDTLMNELTIAREVKLLTMSIKTYVDNAMAQTTSAAAQVVFFLRL